MPDDLFAQPEFHSDLGEERDAGSSADEDGIDVAEDPAEEAEVEGVRVTEPHGEGADEAGTESPAPPRGAASGNAARGGVAKAVLLHIASSLVDDPDAIVVDTTESRSGVRFAVRVAPSDMGRVIGRRGRTVQAIRTLVRAAAASEGIDASVAVDD